MKELQGERKQAVYTDKAPKPVGPYSQGIIAGGCLLFISGQIPIDPETGDLVEGDFEDKVRRVMENVKAIVEAAGGSMDDIIKVTVYIKDISLFSRFNQVYSEYFRGLPPARAVVQVAGLPLGVDLEVEAIAYLC